MTDGLSTSPLSTARGQSSGSNNSTRHTCDSSYSVFSSSDTNGSSPNASSNGTGRCCSRACVVCGQSTANALVVRLSCQHSMCQSCYMNMDIVECPNCYSTVSDVIRFKFRAPGNTTTNNPCPTTPAICKGNIESDTASDEEIEYLEIINVTSHLPPNKAPGSTGRLFPTVSQAHEVTSSLANTACRKISLPIHLAQACNNEITSCPLKCGPLSKRCEDTPPVACSSSSEPTSCSDSDSDDYEDYMGPCSASNSSKCIDVKREHSRATPESQQTYQNVAVFKERHLNPCSTSGSSAISCLSQESGLPCCKMQTTTKNSSFNNSWTEEVYQDIISTINSPTSPLYINMGADTFRAPPPPCDANLSYVNDAASTSSGNSGNNDNDSERELDSIYTSMDGSNSNTRWERRALSAATKLFGDSSSNSTSPLLPHRNRASSDISNLSSAFEGLEARQKQQLQVSSSGLRGLCEGQVQSGRSTSLLGKHVASTDCHSSAGSSTASLGTSPTQVLNCTPNPDICGSRSRSNSNCKPSEVCRLHDGQTIKYFCFTCSTVLCTLCTVLDDNHSRPGHRIFPLSDAEPHCRDQLAELERRLQAEVVLANNTHDKFRRRQRKEVASYESAVEAVNERTAKLMSMLSEWQAETLATLNVQHITASQSLQTATDQAKKHAHTVSSLVNVIKRSGQSSAAWCLSDMGVSARDTLAASKLTYPSVSLCKVSMTTLIQPHMFGSVEENSDSCCQSHYANV